MSGLGSSAVLAPQQTAATADDILDRLSTPWAVSIFWIAFSLVFAAIQILSSSTLTLDSAVTVENVQRHLAAGYQLRNPPLFDWMYYFAQEVFGDGIVALTLLRYALFSAIGILHYVAFRQIGCSRRLAAAFSYSLIFFVWMASDFHYHFTHSLPLFVIGLAAWVSAVAYVDRQEAWLAALLGFLIGLGIVAKWSFLLPTVGAICAFAADRRARAVLMERRSLLIPIFAIVPIVPVATWLLQVDGNVVSVLHDRLVGRPVPYQERVLPAIGSYLESIVLYILPWPIFVGWIGYLGRKRQTSPVGIHANGRLAILATLWTAAIGLAGVIAIGVGNMGTRYMFPVLLTAPIAMVACIATRVDERRFAWGTVNVAAVFTVIAVVIRFWSFQIVDGVAPENREQRIPYEALAHELSVRGLATTQIVAATARDAGNLMAQLPAARAVGLDSIRAEPPPADPLKSRPCVALWGGNSATPPDRPAPPGPPWALRPLLESATGPIEDIFVAWPRPLYGEDRLSVWRILPLPEDAAACRMARGL